ncbi:MAG: hypothetical protein ACHQ4F_16520 [Candidatus Dormibacteria bacterium]
MAWQYRPRSPADEAAHTLTEYELRLRAAESSDRLELNLGTEPPAFSRFNMKRLRNVVFLWTIAVLVIGGVAAWFLDQVLAAETVAVVTGIGIFTALPRVVRTLDGGMAP